MPGIRDKIIIEMNLITGHVAASDMLSEECVGLFGAKAVVEDEVFQQLEKDFNKICYPFVHGIQEINQKLKTRIDEKLKEQK